MRPRLLDLFCGEGGAGTGYHRAGFDVFGVDISRSALRRYPFRHKRADAVQYLAEHGHEFDAIHTSPPCKVHTALNNALTGDDYDSMLFPMATHVDLVGPTRDVLLTLAVPWVIENVPGAPLVDPIMLCGGMFDLFADCIDGRRHLRRHRLFESNVPLTAPEHAPHEGRGIGVYGNGGRARHGGVKSGAYQGDVPESRQAIGAPWMSRDGLSQAIPPAYTEMIGNQLRVHLENAKGTRDHLLQGGRL